MPDWRARDAPQGSSRQVTPVPEGWPPTTDWGYTAHRTLWRHLSAGKSCSSAESASATGGVQQVQ